MPENVFLVGPMGAGKTTIGRALARALHFDFVDSDHEIERRTGASIPLIFDIEGEDGFRKREHQVIDELSQRSGIVLATGGGAVLDPDNRRFLAARGKVIYLYCSVDHQLERTRHDRNRPLLQTENPRAKLELLMTVRDPLYREIADEIIESGTRNTRSVVKTIVDNIQGVRDCDNPGLA